MASLARQRLPLPAGVAAATATDGGGCARQILAVRRRPRRPVNLHIAAMASLARQRLPSAVRPRLTSLPPPPPGRTTIMVLW